MTEMSVQPTANTATGIFKAVLKQTANYAAEIHICERTHLPKDL